jgi:hypothetical protein
MSRREYDGNDDFEKQPKSPSRLSDAQWVTNKENTMKISTFHGKNRRMLYRALACFVVAMLLDIANTR